MSDETSAAPAGGDGALAPVITGTPADNSALSAREAAAILSSRRHPDENAAPDPVERPARSETAPAAEDSARESDPAESADEASDPAERPSIEPPRSWTKEDKEAFAALPPETQQRIAEREKARETEFRRGQNETAEQRKAIQSEAQRAQQLRAQYEAALPALLNTLEQQNAGEFQDIQSWDDVQRMAREDPFRYTQWQATQARIADTKQKLAAAHQTRAQETAKAFETYAEEQDRLFLERAPEFSDGRSAEKARRDAAEYLTKEIGFAEAELANAWNGKQGISLRDAKLQTIIRDAMKWNAAQKAAKASKPAAPVPPVQKPGIAATRQERNGAGLQALDNRLNETGSVRDAAALLAARRAAARR